MVDNLGDSGTGSELAGDLRYCLTQANNLAGDDTITFSVAGIIQLSTALPDLRSNLTIQGPDASLLTVQRYPGASQFSVFHVLAGNTVTVSGLTVQGGWSERGGGIYNEGTLNVKSCGFTENTATYGGAIASDTGILFVSGSTFDLNSADSHGGAISGSNRITISDCTFTRNSAVYAGGAFSTAAVSASITSSTFTRNSAIIGGAIYTEQSLSLTGSDLSENSADDGGGIYNRGSLVINDTSISSNAVSSQGGGVFNNSDGNAQINGGTINSNTSFEGAGIFNRGTLTITAASIDSNTASGQGGGLYNLFGTSTLIGGTVSMNSASQGGGIFNSRTLNASGLTVWGNNAATNGGGIESWGTLNLSNSTVSDNTAARSGGGLLLKAASWSGTETLVNVTIANNRADRDNDGNGEGGGICVEDIPQQPLLKNTLVGGNTRGAVTPSDISGTVRGSSSLVQDGSGGLDPAQDNLGNVDPRLGPLSANGGTSLTHALLAGSPAINAGNNAEAPGSTDQRGLSRIVDGVVDIGAFEYSRGPVLNFTTAAFTTGEGIGSVTVTVIADRPATSAVSIPITVSGTASGSEDYRFTAAEIVIPAGQSWGSTSVVILEDSTDEPDEILILTMGTPTNAHLGPTAATTITISDNDSPPMMGFTSPGQAVAEDVGTALVTLRLSEKSGFDVTVPLTLAPPPGTDYTYAGPMTITIPAGMEAISIPVSVVNDGLGEKAETIRLQLGIPVNATLSPSSTVGFPVHVITISANDTPTVDLSFASPQPGKAPVTTRTRDENDGIVPVYVTLSTPAVYPITATLGFGGTAKRNTDYSSSATTVTIPAGQKYGVVNLTLVPDTTDESTETVTVSLTGLSSTDAGAPAPVALKGASPITLKITDLPILNFSQRTLEASESDQTVRLTAQLNEAASTETRVSIYFSEGTLKRSDLLGPLAYGASVEIVIPAGQRSAYYDVPLNRDGAIERTPELGTLCMGSVTGNVVIGSQYTASLKLYDEPYVTFFASSTAGDEGLTISLAASLTSPTNQDVRVPLYSYPVGRRGGSWWSSYWIPGAAQGSDYTLPAYLVIPRGETVGVGSINTVNDTADEYDEGFRVYMGPPLGALPGDITAIDVRILDNDPAYSTPVVNFSTQTNLVEEGGSTRVRAVLSHAVPYEVSVQIVRSGGNASAADFSLGTDVLRFPAGSTQASTTLSAPASDGSEPTESAVFKLKAPWGGVLVGMNNQQTVYIADADTPPTVFTPAEVNPKPIVVAQPGQLALDPESLRGNGPHGSGGSIRHSGSGQSTGEGVAEIAIKTAVSVMSNGPISGGTLFFDANKNGLLDYLDSNHDGIQDENELSEPVALSYPDGSVALAIPWAFDLDLNGQFDASEGQLVAVGGIDTTIMLPVTIPLIAPMGIDAISPLSTVMASLVNIQGFSVADAHDRVRQAFGLTDVDLTRFYAAGAAAEGSDTGVSVYAVHSMVANTVIMASSLLAGLAGAPPIEYLGRIVFDQLAALVAGPDVTLDLATEGNVESALNGALSATGLELTEEVVVGAAAVIAASNQYIDLALLTATDPLTSISQAKVIARTLTAPLLGHLGSGSATVREVVAVSTGAALEASIQVASVGNVLPPTLAVTDVVQTEGDAGSRVYTFTVVLTQPSVVPVRVHYATNDGEATAAGLDYLPVSGDLEWLPGDTSYRTVQVTVGADQTLEPDESFRLILSNAENAAVRKNIGYGIIRNDDALNYTPPADGTDNAILVQTGSDLLTIERNGDEVLAGAYTLPAPLTVVGMPGVANSLIVRLEGAEPIPGSGLFFQGANQFADTLTILDGSAQNVRHIITGEGTGYFEVDGALIEYAGISEVTDERTVPVAGLPGTSITGTPLVLKAQQPAGGLVTGSTYSWTVTRNGEVIAGASGINRVDFTFTPPAEGDYVVSLSISAEGVGTGTVVQTVHVLPGEAPHVGGGGLGDSVSGRDLIFSNLGWENTTRMLPEGVVSMLEAGFAIPVTLTMANPSGLTALLTGNTETPTEEGAVMGEITGTVFLDENGDDSKQESESGMVGMTVLLDNDRDGVFVFVAETTTDGEGRFRVGNLPAGTYRVRLQLPEGMSACGDGSWSGTLSSEAGSLHVDLGVIRQSGVELSSAKGRSEERMLLDRVFGEGSSLMPYPRRAPEESRLGPQGLVSVLLPLVGLARWRAISASPQTPITRRGQTHPERRPRN